MVNTLSIAAFGALNQASYDMFKQWLEHYAGEKDLSITLKCAGPYPNAEAVTVPGRPLRGDALKDSALMDELYNAVAGDAKSLEDGLDGNFDIYCMPCMSMIGFHDGVERILGKPVIRLADALKDFYKDVEKLGIIHMRPAAKRVQEIFGDKAVTPDEKLAERLLAAETQAKIDKSSAAVEKVMKEIVESFRDQGLRYVLFARADAPTADNSAAAHIKGIQANSYFEILARHIIRHA